MRRDPSRDRRRRSSSLLMEVLEGRLLLTSFIVTNVNDSGPGSLRQVILDANADHLGGIENISVDLGTSDFGTIALMSPLPALTRPISLDAVDTKSLYTYLYLPTLTLDGSAAGAGADGLVLDSGASGSTIKGLSIVNFPGNGLVLDQTTGVTIRENALGVTLSVFDLNTNETSPGPFIAAPSAAGNKGAGLFLDAATGTTIGGANPGDGNTIASNGGAGILGLSETVYVGDGVGQDGVNRTLIEGNTLGASLADVGNGGDGIDLTDQFNLANTIGGTATGAGNTFGPDDGPAIGFNPTNVVSGNNFDGAAVPIATIGISVTATPANLALGTPFTLTYTVQNTSAVAYVDNPKTGTTDLAKATGLRFEFDQSGGKPFVILSGPLTPDTSIKTYQYPFTQATLPDLYAGQSTSFTLGFQATTPGDQAGTIKVSLAGLNQTQTDTSYQVVSSPIVATVAPALQVKVALADVTGFHKAQTVTFTVTNAGNAAEDDARLAIADGDLAPGLVTAVRVSQGTAPTIADFSASGLPIADLGPLDPGASATVSVDLAAIAYVPTVFQGMTYSTTGERGPGDSTQIVAGAGVSNIADSGPGSLRQAILDANADPTPGVEDIGFASISPSTTVKILSPLPAITRSVRIVAAALYPGPNGPQFTIDGTNAGPGAEGLTFGPGSSASTVRELAIEHFSGDGILVTGTSGITIQDDSIGVDAYGGSVQGNGGNGIRIVNSSGIIIGGTASYDGNVIGGNGGYGIDVGLNQPITGFSATFPTGTLIEGNLIGNDAGNGIGFPMFLNNVSLPNAAGGIGLEAGAASDTIGGTATGAGNVISGNGGSGIASVVPVGSTIGVNREVIQGNLIGTNEAGQRDFGNQGYGIAFDTTGLDSGNTIGGPAPGAGNVIAFNKAGYVRITRTTGNFTGNTFAGLPVADVGISVTSTAAPLTVGSPIRLVYTLTNTGPVDATNLRLDFGSFPIGTVVEAGPLTTDPANPSTFDLARLASGGSVTFAVDILATPAVAPPIQDFSVTARSLDQVDPNPADNSVAVSSAVQFPNSDPFGPTLPTDLAVTAMPILAPVKVGSATTLTFLVTNASQRFATDATIAIDLAGLGSARLVGIVISQGGGGLRGGGRAGLLLATLDVISPGYPVTVTVTFVPDRPGVFGGSAAVSAAEADSNGSNNLAFANVEAGMLHVNDVSPLPVGDHVGSILISFSADLALAMARDLRNYHLTIPASKGHKAQPVRLLSATYDRTHHQVLLKLASPRPVLGTPLDLSITNLVATDGSVLAGGRFSATITEPAPLPTKPHGRWSVALPSRDELGREPEAVLGRMFTSG